MCPESLACSTMSLSHITFSISYQLYWLKSSYLTTFYCRNSSIRLLSNSSIAFSTDWRFSNMEMEPLQEVMQYYHKKEYVTVSVACTDQSILYFSMCWHSQSCRACLFSTTIFNLKKCELFYLSLLLLTDYIHISASFLQNINKSLYPVNHLTSSCT